MAVSNPRSLCLLLVCTILVHQLSGHAAAGQSTTAPAENTSDLDAANSEWTTFRQLCCCPTGEPGQQLMP
jgi:hypothetical protein